MRVYSMRIEKIYLQNAERNAEDPDPAKPGLYCLLSSRAKPDLR